MPEWKHGSKEADVVPEPGLRCVYRVRSRSKPGEYHLVDLLDNAGHGSCTCQAHLFRVWPKLKKGPKLGEPGTACWHVAQARDFFMLQLLERMALDETEPKKR